MMSLAGTVYAALLILNMSAGPLPVEGVEVIADRQNEYLPCRANRSIGDHPV